MASWLMNNQKLSPMGLMIKDEMNMSYVFGQKQKSSSIDLMQNCDLPPPLKVFSGPDKSVLSPMNDNVWRRMEEEHEGVNIELKQEEGSDRLELLKALRRSQTRAREAERKYLALHKEKEALSNLMLEESARSIAYKNWIKVLELQILQLKTQKQQQQQQHEHVETWHRTKEDENGTNGITWFMAIAFCLGIAAIGCRYLL
ncbi:uncharacterized protein LOC132060551 [Lycium ferocissimum]|uniref:uncharacterized protein LOC132060551 n=1 Tax=Lycium ferocissimum TaxID=112874 RepID=UPI0028158700|nr:uncharacterized protein LOC132060551 [Lycium ferocissimum]